MPTKFNIGLEHLSLDKKKSVYLAYNNPKTIVEKLPCVIGDTTIEYVNDKAKSNIHLYIISSANYTPTLLSSMLASSQTDDIHCLVQIVPECENMIFENNIAVINYFNALTGENQDHHFRTTCISCGNITTCRCSAPKTDVYVRKCYGCKEKGITPSNKKLFDDQSLRELILECKRAKDNGANISYHSDGVGWVISKISELI